MHWKITLSNTKMRSKEKNYKKLNSDNANFKFKLKYFQEKPIIGLFEKCLDYFCWVSKMFSESTLKKKKLILEMFVSGIGNNKAVILIKENT